MIRKYGGVKAEMLFLEEVARGAYEIAPDEARTVTGKYRGLNVGLADASIAVLAAQRTVAMFSLDRRRFRALRVGRKAFRTLPVDR